MTLTGGQKYITTINGANSINITTTDNSIIKDKIPDVKTSAINSLSRSAHVLLMSMLRSFSVTVSRSGLLNVPTENKDRASANQKKSVLNTITHMHIISDIY